MMTTIRAAVIGDQERLAKLNGLVQDLHLQHRPDHFQASGTSGTGGVVRFPLLRNQTHGCRWPEGTRQARWLRSGHLSLSPENPFTQARAWCEIDQIAVDWNCRKRGIGRALVLQAIARGARAEGIQRVEATSWSFNEEAHEVFRHLGFTPKTVRFELELPDRQTTAPTRAAQQRLPPPPPGANVKRSG